MIDETTIKGLRVKYLPDKIVVGAKGKEGVLMLKWLCRERAVTELRWKLSITETDWPHYEFSMLHDGTIFMVTFTR